MLVPATRADEELLARRAEALARTVVLGIVDIDVGRLAVGQ